MWKKALVLVLAAIISISGGFFVGYVVQNGGFADLPSMLGFEDKTEKDKDWSGKTLTTADNIVNVRKTAEKDGEIIATLNKNTEVVCINQDTKDWCFVKVMEGVEGYVLTSFMTYVGDYSDTTETEPKAPAEAEPKDAFVKVTGSYASIRTSGDENSDVAGIALKDDVLEKTSSEGDWIGVKTADGVSGFIAADAAVDATASKAENAARYTVTITNGYANIRSEATSDSNQVTKMNQGETATYLGEDNGWYYILMDDGKTGYVRNDLASSDAE